MWRLVSFIVLALVGIFGLTFSLNAAKKYKESTEFCDVLFPLAGYNVESLQDSDTPSGQVTRVNLVHPKTKKSTILNLNPNSFEYELDGKNFKWESNFRTTGCDCMKEFVQETQNPGTIMQYFAEIECANQECFNLISDEKKDELIQRYLESPCGFCEQDNLQAFCDCMAKRTGSLKKYAPPNSNEQDKCLFFLENEDE